MMLCDIGNSNADFYQDGKMWTLPHRQLKTFVPTEKVYYISVNETMSQYVNNHSAYIDLEPYFEFDTIYQGLGIDRIAACTSIQDGMIIDAGSAITVDIMSGGVHLGGFILPGISAYERAYSSISKRLEYQLNPHVPLDVLPQKTNDALSYGALKSILLLLEVTCKDKKMYFTGGDGKFFSTFFSNALFDRTLIFRGMLKTIKASHLI